MLDINLFRAGKGADLEVVRASQRARFADPALVDTVAALDTGWRDACYEKEQLNRAFNQLNKEIAARRKAGQDATELQQQSKTMKAQIQQAADKEEQVQRQRDQLLCSIGNLVHPSVPIHQNEAFNEVILESQHARRGVTQQERSNLLNHPDLVRRLAMVNLEAGTAAAGGRGFYLLDDGVMLNQALIAYGLHFLRERGWLPVQTPYWLTADSMARCAQLAQFDEELYRLSGSDDSSCQSTQPHTQYTTSGKQANTQGASTLSNQQPDTAGLKYLIATSEQALCALHQDSWLEPSDLPIQYAGFSTCFRREVGSHGKDTLGIFRVHQFDKVEQFAITSPYGTTSQDMLHGMMQNAQDFYDSLGIPYRVVRIVSRALNAAAACKLDLEAWFPASGSYRELVSASNCTDYQARRLNVRMRVSSTPAAGSKPSGNSAHPHMLNATLCATQRTICCLLENHQTSEGVKVPAVLQPYMHGQDFIKFPTGTTPSSLLATAGRKLLKAAKSVVR